TSSCNSSGAMMEAGEPAPASKCSLRTSWPALASVSESKISELETPVALSNGSHAAPMKRSTSVPAQTLRGLPSTREATLCHNLCELFAAFSSLEYFGVTGQKAIRPNRYSSAGSSVSAETHAKKIPVAAIGPRERFEFRSETSKHSRAIATVAAEAVIALNDAFHEARNESATDSLRCNSSRWRATMSSE